MIVLLASSAHPGENEPPIRVGEYSFVFVVFTWDGGSMQDVRANGAEEEED